MVKLTKLQIELLVSIAKCSEGAFAPKVARKATAGLIRRGLVMEVCHPGAPSRLVVTEAGKALSAGKPTAVAKGVEGGEIKSPAAAPARRTSAIGSVRAPVVTNGSLADLADDIVDDKTAAAAERSSPAAEPKGKIAILIGLLRRSNGATLAEMMAATGWQAHSVRGTLSGAIKKRLGETVLSRSTGTGRVYSLSTEGNA